MPESMKDAAIAAIRDDINQYAITWGSKKLRNAICDKYSAGTEWRSTRRRN